MVKKGIPLEVLEELDIHISKKPRDEFEVTAVVEKHQVKLPLPGEVRRELEFVKGKKLRLKFDAKTKSLTYFYGDS